MTDFNVSNKHVNFVPKTKEVNSQEAPEVAYANEQLGKQTANVDLSLDPSAAIGKSMIKVDKTPKYDAVLMESLLKFMKEQPDVVCAFNDAYDAAIDAGYSAQAATAFGEEALERIIAEKVKNSNYVAPDGGF